MRIAARAYVVVDHFPKQGLSCFELTTSTQEARVVEQLIEPLARQTLAFARCRGTADYDIGMKNFIQNGPRVPAVFLHE